MSRETILRQYLDTVKQNYDYILLDCMPSLGMLTVNALAAADNVLIPVQAAYLPAKGLEQLLGTINKVKRQINPKLRIEDMTFYVVSCMSTITMDKEEAICLNEHRSVVTTVECEDDIFFDMGSLICELDDICLFELLADVDATIYEL